MEQSYWLGRKRAAGVMARRATSAEARLIHFELAGRYSVRAAACGQVPLFARADDRAGFPVDRNGSGS
jgi:hypothetical protein